LVVLPSRLEGKKGMGKGGKKKKKGCEVGGSSAKSEEGEGGIDVTTEKKGVGGSLRDRGGESRTWGI